MTTSPPGRVPRPDWLPARRRASDSLRRYWTLVDGRPVHARVTDEHASAEAPVVVLVHGLLVSSRYMIRAARCLAPCARVWAPDLPGYGRSAKPDHILSVPELADALVAWMQAVGIARAALVGNSLGCQIVVDAALRYPALVGRLVLVGPTIDRHSRTAFQQTARLLLDGLREPISYMPVLLRDTWDVGARRGLRTFQYGLQDRIEVKLPHVQAPALVLRGERDPIAPQCWSEEVTALLPSARLVVIPGAAHVVHFSHPQVFAEIVAPFLSAGDHRR